MFTPLPGGKNVTADAVPSSCSTEITPACRKHILTTCLSTRFDVCVQLVEDLYGIPKTAGSQTASQIGVSGFIQQFAQKADLKVCFLSSTSIHVLTVIFFSQSFLTAFRTDLSSSTTFALQTLDGGSNPQSAADAGIEAVR